MTPALVHAISLGQARQVDFRGETVGTGIYKTPVPGPVRVLDETLEGDRQVDRRFHGGADKAVYCYPMEHYAYWAEKLQRSDLNPGQFGENFTTVGLLEGAVWIGDRFAVGSAVFEVTQPRVPCFKLGIKMGNAGFVKQFMVAQRCGFYLRVLQKGTVAAGDTIRLIQRGAAGLSVARVNRLHFFDTDDVAGLRAALSEPALSASWRAELDEVLAGR